jgi:hypothetical protein
LFLLYINDIGNVFNGLSVKFKLYADDLKLYSVYDVRCRRNDLDAAFNRLNEWSITWQLVAISGEYRELTSYPVSGEYEN